MSWHWRRRATAIAGSALLASTGLVLATTGAARASQNQWGTPVPVGAGISPNHIQGAIAFGNTPSATPEQVSFILRAQNLDQLESSVEHGSHMDLTVSQFAAQYGQTQANIQALESYLSGFGITTTAYPDGLDVVANGTAGEFDQALSVSQQQWETPSQPSEHGHWGKPADYFHGTNQEPLLPSQIASYTLAVLGLTNYAMWSSQADQVPAGSPIKPTTTASSGDQLESLLPSDFAQNYDVTPLYHAGDTGAGQTIGIVTLAALDTGAPETFWTTEMGLSSYPTVNVQNIDGGPGAPSQAAGSGETDLDVEQSGGLAQAATIDVYQAPNSDNGFADAFFTAASQDVAGSVSCSWGESETVIAAAVASGVETPTYQAAFDEAFLELAAQGQSTFIATGDYAAYQAIADLGTTNLSIGSPSDSPYVTAAGGTTLPWSGTVSNSATPTAQTFSFSVPSQRIWAWDYFWQAITQATGAPEIEVAETYFAGSNGGYSVDEPQPSYQDGITNLYSAVPYFTPTQYQNVDGIIEPTNWNFNGNPPTIHGYGSGRATPDVSADADPFTGYMIYTSGGPSIGWGGTSFVAPQLAGVTALINEYVGGRVGFWNPSVYSFATSRNSPFTPTDQPGTSNDNLYYSGTPGTVYNPGDGLGYPDVFKLAGDFKAFNAGTSNCGCEGGWNGGGHTEGHVVKS